MIREMSNRGSRLEKNKTETKYRQKKTPHCGVSSEIGRRERIRTSDPLVPNQLRYQAALLADFLLLTLHGLSTYVHVNLNKIYMFCVVRREGLEPSRP